MNKHDLVQLVAKRLETSRAQAGAIVDLFFASDGIIAAELRRGGSIQVTGFGNFVTRKRSARTGRNPRTGAEIRIKPTIAPVFRAGKGLKDVVNRGKK